MKFESAHSNTTAKQPINTNYVSRDEHKENGTRCQYNDVSTVLLNRKDQQEKDVSAKACLLMASSQEHQLYIQSIYNDAKNNIVEQSVKKSVGANSGAQYLAFMTASSTSSTNDVNTATLACEDSFRIENPNGSNLLQQDLEQIYEDDLEAIDLKWQPHC
ncbi:hypothetical protein Tco_0351176 [Tanacetum coccineum]